MGRTGNAPQAFQSRHREADRQASPGCPGGACSRSVSIAPSRSRSASLVRQAESILAKFSFNRAIAKPIGKPKTWLFAPSTPGLAVSIAPSRSRSASLDAADVALAIEGVVFQERPNPFQSRHREADRQANWRACSKP